MLYVVDGGRSAVGQAARVRTEYRSHGLLFKVLFPFINSYISKHLPDVSDHMGTTISWHLFAKDLWKLLGYRVDINIQLISFHCTLHVLPMAALCTK